MADYGLAAQVGTGGGQNAFNPMQSMAQFQNMSNAMLQGQQLQQQMQQQNALRGILSQSGGKVTPEIIQGLVASGNYEPALALQRHQASMGSIGVQTQAAQTALEEARLKLGETKRTIAASNAVTDYLAKTPDYANPDALNVLRERNPDAWRMVNKHIGEVNEINAKARKEGTNATEAQVKLAQTSANFVLGLLPGIKDQASYNGVYNYIVSKDPKLASIVGPEFTADNLSKLQALATQINDLKTETRDGVTTIVAPRLNTERLVNAPAAVPSAPMQTGQVAPPVAPLPTAAPGVAASMNATNAMGPAGGVPPTNAMAAPVVDPVAVAREQARLRALAAKEAEAAAQARGTAAGKTTAEEIALTPQIETAIKNIENAIKPGGLLDKATGSGIGNIIDKSLGFLGVATGGSVATAQLQPIADMALKLVPRFEGPQSDADRQSYVDAAGALADATKPVEARRAAAQTIVRLMQERKDQFGVNKGQAGEGMPGERRAASSGPVTVQIPGGKAFSFPNQAAADKFRKEAGL